MEGWMEGWMEGGESRVKDCLQQSKTLRSALTSDQLCQKSEQDSKTTYLVIAIDQLSFSLKLILKARLLELKNKIFFFNLNSLPF